MIYLHPEDRTKCAAIRHVIVNTSLVNCSHEIDHYGTPAIALTLESHFLSSGEYVLWEFCRSIAGERGVSLFEARAACDDHSLRVMSEALSLWFGIGELAAS